MIKTDLKLYSVRDVAKMFRVMPGRIRTIIGRGRIPAARYVGSSWPIWAIPEGSVVLPDPETDLSPGNMYAKHGGNIIKYIALCEERGVPARIPTYEWYKPEPSQPHVKLTDAEVAEMRRLREEEGTKYRELARLFNVSEGTVSKRLSRKRFTTKDMRSCLICGGSGQLIAENEQFGDLAFPCRECSGTGEAPRE